MLCPRLVLVLVAVAGPAAAMPAGFVPGERVAVTAVPDGGALRLADGRELSLSGIETPQAVPPQGGPPDPALAALAEAARRTLADLAQGRTATLYAAQRLADGHVVAQVEIDQHWAQAELLARGLARVHTSPETADGAADMLRIEADARQARLGIWTHPAFRVRSVDQAGRWIGTFQIIEGRLSSAGSDDRGRVLTFVEEGSEVLNVIVPATAIPRFEAAGIVFGKLTGWRSLRVRGWLRAQDGPSMELDHPAQLETGG